MDLLSSLGTVAVMVLMWLLGEPGKMFSKGKVKKAGGGGQSQNLCSGLHLFFYQLYDLGHIC